MDDSKSTKSNNISIEAIPTVVIEVPPEEKIVRRGSIRFKGMVTIFSNSYWVTGRIEHELWGKTTTKNLVLGISLANSSSWAAYEIILEQNIDDR